MKPCYLVTYQSRRESGSAGRTCVGGDLSNGFLFNRLTTELIELIAGDELRCIDLMRSSTVVQLQGEPEGQTWGL